MRILKGFAVINLIIGTLAGIGAIILTGLIILELIIANFPMSAVGDYTGITRVIVFDFILILLSSLLIVSGVGVWKEKKWANAAEAYFVIPIYIILIGLTIYMKIT
jgi:hypothetical protein